MTVNEHQKSRFSEALTRLSGDTDLLCCMASMVIQDANQVYEQLKRSIEVEDSPATAATGHKLKGMLSTFETNSPIIELQELIEMARRGESETVRRQFELIRPDVERLIDEVGNLASDEARE